MEYKVLGLTKTKSIILENINDNTHWELSLHSDDGYYQYDTFYLHKVKEFNIDRKPLLNPTIKLNTIYDDIDVFKLDGHHENVFFTYEDNGYHEKIGQINRDSFKSNLDFSKDFPDPFDDGESYVEFYNSNF